MTTPPSRRPARPRPFAIGARAACLAGAIALLGACATDDPNAGGAGSGTARTTTTTDSENTSMSHYRMTTSKGEIIIELDPEKAPISTENFRSYANDGRYDGTIFHRVISGFMIQGGGFEPDMTKRPTDAPIKNEWQNGLANARGSIAMARLGGDADSATSQFFINTVDNRFLDAPQPDGAAYAVFGRVIAGMDTVDAIEGVQTTNVGGYSDVPAEPVVIQTVEAISADQARELAGG